ncbi:hypothetical protein PCS8106_02360 [Streptococcus pneumoniae PCS8106]|nr:hypothetical protein PCS8106_02360 [Streptococcus pneumoniae PCS8106]
MRVIKSLTAMRLLLFYSYPYYTIFLQIYQTLTFLFQNLEKYE